MLLFIKRFLPIAAIIGLILVNSCGFGLARANPSNRSFFIRLKVNSATGKNLRITLSGYRHKGAPWRFPRKYIPIKKGDWSEWIDLSEWNWHGKVFRAGGIAEYPSISILAFDLDTRKTITGGEFEVQLADGPSQDQVQVSFSEKTDGDTIIFLAPYPLRENRNEFETARDMSARHEKWAKEATNNKAINLRKFEIISNLWTRHDPFIVNQELATLRFLGFNVYAGTDFENSQKFGMKTVGKSNIYVPDPALATDRWNKKVASFEKSHKSLAESRRLHSDTAYYEISDEVSALNFRRTKKVDLDKWFRSYLRQKDVSAKDLGSEIDRAEYPLVDLYKDSLPKNVSLKKRKLLFYAAKFGQWWSVRQLRHSSNLIRKTFPGMETGTLLPSHGFLGNAWGPTKIGMTYQMLDSFELAQQNAVTQISTEDWLGLNHMYGPGYTWTGGQTFGYLNALNRSAIGKKPILMRTFLTVSDDKYLRLKAHSAIGQGVKSIYFWSYGPTFASTENYWSDLKSHYFGVAKLNRSLEKTENVLHPAKTVSDPVAILYSVSHDIWNNDRQAVFTERRLLWHALRHLHIQPDFVREEDLASGGLKNYKVLYISDWNITRRASAAIDKWIRNGGVVYLSAGAATRDEFNTPFIPDFAKLVWNKNAANNITHQNITYNERTSLRKIDPLTNALVDLDKQSFKIPVIGVRLKQKAGSGTFARFEGGGTAARIHSYGKGKIIAVSFMPMLAYGQLANFQPAKLKEKWKPEPRAIISKPLEFAGITPIVTANVPVVEVNYLEGPIGSALVLANYTYKPVEDLIIKIRTGQKFTRVISSNGERVEIIDQTPDRITIKTALNWTDIITLQ